MKINLYNKYGKITFNYRQAVKAVKDYFTERKSISLILVSAAEIQEINRQYRSRDYPTDVISFESGEKVYLGDIFICLDKVYEQAQLYGHSPDREFAFLLVHGLLHLQGYDHQNPEEEALMIARQEKILNAINYRREL